jgi:hypothetical protein
MTAGGLALIHPAMDREPARLSRPRRGIARYQCEAARDRRRSDQRIDDRQAPTDRWLAPESRGSSIQGQNPIGEGRFYAIHPDCRFW